MVDKTTKVSIHISVALAAMFVWPSALLVHVIAAVLAAAVASTLAAFNVQWGWDFFILIELVFAAFVSFALMEAIRLLLFARHGMDD